MKNFKKIQLFNIIFGSWFFFCLCGLFSNVSCNRNRFDVDVSEIKADIKISRMEKAFFSANQDSLTAVHQHLHEKYGIFYQRFIENITGIGLVNDPAISYSLKTFLSDKYVKEVFEDTKKKFSDDLRDIDDGFTDAFRHCKYYFPEMVIPEVITFVSGFQYACAVTDSVLGIGLDMYLGSDYPNYPKAGFPLYKISQMRREFIIPDAMKSWLMTEFFSEETPAGKNMLGAMIQYGKIMFLLDAIIPEAEDSIKAGYSAVQLEWCVKNQFQIWAHLVDNELLFITEPQTITKFFNDAPFTSGLPKESPPKVGVWVGWQIVRSFMDNNSDVSIQELMRMENPQEILNKSKYKPKNKK